VRVDVERVHAVADLERLVEYDTELRGNESRRRGACPFCPCTNPRRHRCDRFRLSADHKRWYCRHCTVKGGDAIAYVQKRYRLNFTEACVLIAGHALLVPPKHDIARAHQLSEPSNCLSRQYGSDGSETATRLRPRPLADNSYAKNYVVGRKIPLDVATAAGLGWLSKGGKLWIAAPFLDQHGTTVAWQRRAVGEVPEDERHMTDGRKGHGLFFTGPLEQSVIAITEGVFDALSLAVAGIGSVAIGGTAYGPPWLNDILLGHHVLLAHDAEPIGDQAAQRLAEHLEDVTLERVRPSRKDWNDVLVHDGAEAIRQQVRG